ncbi:MAG: NADH-quinone oxidoreductase subunit L [Polyangiales bacterium]
MPDLTLTIVGLAPLALILVGLVPSVAANRRPGGMLAMARWATIASFGVALVAAAGFFLGAEEPSVHGLVLGIGGVGFTVYYDALSAVMALLVSFVGIIVIQYSRSYLDGDPGQGRFIKWLCLTLAAVLTITISGNLLQFTLAWVASSLCLHKLLLFYADRRAARLAARKKFIASRLGDLCLISTMVLIYSIFGSLDFATVFSAANGLEDAATLPASIHVVALFVVIGAMLKSAQFPFHGWLTEVMETPTPVSALLHAGIINAGGFLILRLADVISLSVPALEMLAVVGGFTALFGSVVMLTQTSVKVSLAWSTIAQMGFMMLQCGLGAFSAAALHIVAHSLYKAHAFLSSGSVVELSLASWVARPHGKPHPLRLVVALMGAVALTWGVSLAFGASLTRAPGIFALGAIVVMGVTHLVANAIDERPSPFVILRGVGLAFAVAIAYFALQLGAEQLLAGAVPEKQALRGPLDLAIVAVVVLLFGAVTVLQNTMPYRMAEPRWQAIYVHVFNGLYVNTITNRLVQRWWPIDPSDTSKGANA